MDEILSRAQKLGAEFADVRFQRSNSLTITADNTGVKIVESGQREGYCTRVVHKGNLGYKNSSSLKQSDAEDAVAAAFGNGKTRVSYLSPKKDSVTPKQKYPLEAKSPEEKLQEVRRMFEISKKLDKRIVSVNVLYKETASDKHYMSTDGRDIKQKQTYSAFYVQLFGKDRNISTSGFESVATHTGNALEVFGTNAPVEKAYERLKLQFNGIVPKAGEYPIVMGPAVTGVFCHEAVGHSAEADAAETGVIGARLGDKLAKDEVTIVDSPKIDYPRALGTYKYDDEGVEAIDVNIIDKGKVSGLLLDREYAKLRKRVPTGNARADGPFVPPLIRMRNTFMKPGKLSKEELCEMVKNGFLMESFSGGTTTKDGTFQFGIMEGHVIKNGRIEGSLRDVGISAHTVDTLGNIMGLSKDFNIQNGVCGKGGQSAPCGTGGPYTAIKKIKVGGNV